MCVCDPYRIFCVDIAEHSAAFWNMQKHSGAFWSIAGREGAARYFLPGASFSNTCAKSGCRKRISRARVQSMAGGGVFLEHVCKERFQSFLKQSWAFWSLSEHAKAFWSIPVFPRTFGVVRVLRATLPTHGLQV